MNTEDYVALNNNVIAAYQAYQRVCLLFWRDISFDRGALCNFMYDHLESTGLKFPDIALRHEGGKYNSEFQEWLQKLDSWFDTIAALYYIDLPKEE